MSDSQLGSDIWGSFSSFKNMSVYRIETKGLKRQRVLERPMFSDNVCYKPGRVTVSIVYRTQHISDSDDDVDLRVLTTV